MSKNWTPIEIYLQIVNELTDFEAAIDILRAEVAELSTTVNLKMSVVENQASTGGHVQFNKVNVSKPKS